jgi:hypothetical protein
MLLAFVKNENNFLWAKLPNIGPMPLSKQANCVCDVPILTIPKQVRHTCWRGNTKHPMNRTPEKTSIMTIKEKMLNDFKLITKTTNFTSIPIPSC